MAIYTFIGEETGDGTGPIEFNNITSGYDELLVVVLNVTLSTGGDSLAMRTSDDGGTTFDADANGYQSGLQTNGTVTIETNSRRINLGGVGTITGTYVISELDNGSRHTQVRGHTLDISAAADADNHRPGGCRFVHEASDSIQFGGSTAFNDGAALTNIAGGTIRLYGITYPTGA